MIILTISSTKRNINYYLAAASSASPPVSVVVGATFYWTKFGQFFRSVRPNKIKISGQPLCRKWSPVFGHIFLAEVGIVNTGNALNSREDDFCQQFLV